MASWYQKHENIFKVAKVNIETDSRDVILLQYFYSLGSTEDLRETFKVFKATLICEQPKNYNRYLIESSNSTIKILL